MHVWNIRSFTNRFTVFIVDGKIVQRNTDVKVRIMVDNVLCFVLYKKN